MQYFLILLADTYHHHYLVMAISITTKQHTLNHPHLSLSFSLLSRSRQNLSNMRMIQQPPQTNKIQPNHHQKQPIKKIIQHRAKPRSHRPFNLSNPIPTLKQRRIQHHKWHHKESTVHKYWNRQIAVCDFDSPRSTQS